MKILVTGAKGFVGRNLCAQLKNIRDGKAVFYPLCNVPTVLRRISMKELSELVETPLGENISCLEYEDERSRSMSDDQVLLYLFEEFGISDGQQLQRLD